LQIRNKQSLTGNVDNPNKLCFDVGGCDKLSGSVNVSSVFTASNETYSGPYSVTPSMEPKTLSTKDKLMTKDVTVQAVPVFRVSNTSGGTTVYIANEV
jgi:hypothetical protein